MRILHTIRSVNPQGGGLIEAITQLSRIHQTTGHQVEIASLDAPTDPWVGECSVRVHALGPATGRYGYSPVFTPWLREHRKDYDVTIVNGCWQYNSYGVWRGFHNCDAPYFVMPHGMLDPWFKRTYPLKHLKKWLYWPWAEYRVLRDARCVFFTGEEERRLARQSFWLYRCHEDVTPLGTSAPAGEAAQQKEAFLEKFPACRARHLLLFLGRLHEKKGCDLLLRAYAQTKEDWMLVMAGPDQTEPRGKLQNLAAQLGIQDRVVWTGMLGGDLKWGALRCADVFILPSHQENFGLAVVEALACSVPVLISNQVNIWREIQQDRAGVVAPDNLEGTVQLLNAWKALPETERASMRQNAQRCFVERFEIHQSANRLIQALRRHSI